VAQDPRPGQAPQGGLRGDLAAGLGGVPRARLPELWTTAAPAPAVCDRPPHGSRAGEGPEPVRPAPTVVGRIPPPQRTPSARSIGRPARRRVLAAVGGSPKRPAALRTGPLNSSRRGIPSRRQARTVAPPSDGDPDAGTVTSGPVMHDQSTGGSGIREQRPDPAGIAGSHDAGGWPAHGPGVEGAESPGA
jgi:hypothetical protein